MAARITRITRKGEDKCQVQVGNRFHTVATISEALEWIEGLKALLNVEQFEVTLKEVICGIKKDMVYIENFTY